MRITCGVAELKSALQSSMPPVLLDVRWALGDSGGHGHYMHAHIPGAVYVDLPTELADPDARNAGRHPLPTVEQLQGAARRWGIRSRKPVVVYDDSGNLAAARAWWLLRWAGVEDVTMLDGGLGAWRAAGFEMGAGEELASAEGDVELSAGHMPTSSADEAADLAVSGVLLDARAAERYRGDVEPVDPRAGHIPGAISAPTTANIDADGFFLAPDVLRERFGHLRGQVGVYCGSGVTASHEIAALASAGIDAALFPGSWSQWSSDPSRPVATGPQPR